MEIQYFGHSSFLIKTQKAIIVCDPFPHGDPKIGLKFPSGINADIVTVSHDHFDHSAVSEIMGNPYIIREPGEFEVKGVNVFGLESYHDEKQGTERGKNIIYLIEDEGLNVCHLGDLGAILDSEQANELNEVDILMIPVGGTYTLDVKKVMEVINQIEPEIVIPMHYAGQGDTMSDLAPVEVFLKEIGQEQAVKMDKFVIKSREELGEETRVIILNKRS